MTALLPQYSNVFEAVSVFSLTVRLKVYARAAAAGAGAGGAGYLSR